MRSEGDVNYAANPYGLPPERARRRAFPKSLLLTVAGVTVFAGGVLAALSLGGGKISGGPPPMIEADATPTKSRPLDAGQEDAAPPDRLVYERLSGATRPSVERLLPPPEQPLPRPIVAADPTPEPPAAPPPPVPQAPAAASPANMLAPPSAAGHAQNGQGQNGQGQNGHAQNGGAQNGGAQNVAAASPAAGQNGQNHAANAGKPAAGQKPAAQQTLVPPGTPQPLGAPPSALKPPGSQQLAAAPAKPPAAPAASSGGGWRVQLASVRTETEAASEWRRLQSRHPGVLGGMSMQVAKADLGDKGVFYRVQGGGLDEARARAACEQLRSQNVGCVVVKP